MGTPGSGRYTIYLPVKSLKTDRLSKLFKGGLGGLYDGKETNAEAAAAAVLVAKSVLNGKGDQDLFGNGISLSYGDSPNTADVKWNKAGDPANPYVADLTSPGPGKTAGTENIKPGFDSKNPTVNTTSPSATAPRLGSISLGENLQGGKSSIE